MRTMKLVGMGMLLLATSAMARQDVEVCPDPVNGPCTATQTVMCVLVKATNTYTTRCVANDRVSYKLAHKATVGPCGSAYTCDFDDNCENEDK